MAAHTDERVVGEMSYAERVLEAREQIWLLENPFRVVREKRGLTTGQVASRTGLRRSAVTGVESEYTGRFTVAVAVRIADALGVKASTLMLEWVRWLEDHPRGKEAGRANLSQVGWFGKG